MSIRINLEIGHEASLRTKRTPEGFTHDWEVFVRGCDKADIHNYVEKVVFNLHETFPRPKRIIKEPPYSVKESGYAGFTFPIDIYLRNRDEPKVITFDYDLQLQPSGPSISNVQKEKYVFNSVADDFKHRLLKGGGVIVSINAQDNTSDSRLPEEKNQLYNKPNFGGSSSDSNKKHKGGAKVPQSQMPNEPRPSSDFVNLFGDSLIFKTNPPSSGGGDANKAEKADRGDSKDGRSNKEKTSDKDKSKSKLSPNITKDRDKDNKSSKQDKPTISEPPERNKKDDKRNKDRGREKQRDRSKEEKASNSSNSNTKRDKSPRPKSPSPITKRSLSPKRRTATPSPSPKRPPSPSPSPVQQKQHKSDKRSNDSTKDKDKDKDRSKEDRKKDKKDKRDKEHKENKHKEHRSKDLQAPKKDKEPPKVVEAPATAKVDKKDKSNRDKDKEKEAPKEQERVQQTPPTIVEKSRNDQSTSKVNQTPVEQISVQVQEKPSKHKHKKKDKDKKQKSSSGKSEKEDNKKDSSKDKDSRKDKKENKSNKLSIEQFIAEPKSSTANNFSRDDMPPKGKSKSIIDDDSSNSSIEDLTDDRFKSVEEAPTKVVDKPPEPKKPQVKPQEVAVAPPPPPRKEKPPKPKKEKRQQIIEQNDDDNDGSSKKKKKRKATDSAKANHKSAEQLNDYSDVDLNKASETAGDLSSEPPEKIPREDLKEESKKESSNGKTQLNNSKVSAKDNLKEVSSMKEEITDDAEDYLKILRELQTKIMSLQDNMELQRVVQLIAETGRYEVSDRTFDFDLCLLDRSTVRQLQEFFANLTT